MYDAIPLDEIRARQEAIRASLGQRGLDAILVVGRSFYDRVGDLAYVSNHFPPFPATVFAGGQRGLGHALLLIPASGPSALLLDGWAYRREMVAADEVEASPDLPALLVAVLKRRGLGGARVGLVGEDILPLAMARALGDALPALELRRADEVVRAMRRIKSPAEQSLLRRAADIAGAGLDAAVGALRGAGAGQAEQLTERAVCAEGIARAMREGADFVRYLRVHAGSWSAVGSRWPQATERPIAPGEVVTLDIIGAYQGYQFDVLRTTVAGPPDVRPAPAHRRLLEAVLEAARRAAAACRPGTPCRDVVQAANGYLEAQGYGPFARTFMGHGIGLETVEEPYLTPDDPTPLAPGMVLCVEPGVYVPDGQAAPGGPPGPVGASIEEEVLVTEGEPEVLTRFPARLWE